LFSRRPRAVLCPGPIFYLPAQERDPEEVFYFHLFEELGRYGKPDPAHTGAFKYFIPKSPFSVYGQPPCIKELN